MPEIHLLSGGIDSVGILYRRAAETTAEIHALHIRGDWPSAKADTWAARRIAIWLARNVRPIVYHEFAFARPKDISCASGLFAIQGLAVGTYVNQYPYIGTVVQGTNGDIDQTEGSLARNAYREGVCAAVCAGHSPTPTWIAPHDGTPKQEIYRAMPPELRTLCMSCHQPVPDGDGWARCGACRNCERVGQFEEAL